MPTNDHGKKFQSPFEALRAKKWTHSKREKSRKSKSSGNSMSGKVQAKKDIRALHPVKATLHIPLKKVTAKGALRSTMAVQLAA
jgi:hypothetical protein